MKIFKILYFNMELDIFETEIVSDWKNVVSEFSHKTEIDSGSIIEIKMSPFKLLSGE